MARFPGPLPEMNVEVMLFEYSGSSDRDRKDLRHEKVEWDK